MLHHACLLLLRIRRATQRAEPDLRSRHASMHLSRHASLLRACRRVSHAGETHGRDSHGRRAAAARASESCPASSPAANLTSLAYPLRNPTRRAGFAQPAHCMHAIHAPSPARLQETHGRDSLGRRFAMLRPRERANPSWPACSPAAKMHVSTAHYLR